MSAASGPKPSMAGPTGARFRGGRFDSLVPGLEGDRHQWRSSAGTATSRMTRVSVERNVRGLKMKKLFVSAGVFLRTFRSCIERAAKDTETHYYIPKSRFRGADSDRAGLPVVTGPGNSWPFQGFFHNLRSCISKAWEETDSQYHIPKSRFQDLEYNGTAYSAPQVQGVFSRIGTFLWTVKSCISTAWEESEHYYHLPKSRYQDPGFVREKMDTAPKPEVKLLISPRVVKLGVVGENTEDGWAVRPSGSQPDEEFFVPDDVAGLSQKPEVTPE